MNFTCTLKVGLILLKFDKSNKSAKLFTQLILDIKFKKNHARNFLLFFVQKVCTLNLIMSLSIKFAFL